MQSELENIYSSIIDDSAISWIVPVNMRVIRYYANGRMHFVVRKVRLEVHFLNECDNVARVPARLNKRSLFINTGSLVHVNTKYT